MADSAKETGKTGKKEGTIEKLMEKAGGLEGIKSKVGDLLDKTDIDEKIIGKVKDKFAGKN